MFALFIHIYYPDSWNKVFRDHLADLKIYSPTILVNLCLTHPHNSSLVSSIRNDFPEAFIITTPNKGKDIGGKFALIDFFLKAKLRSEYIVFLHDKQSNHWFAGELWRKKLFTIIDPEMIKIILGEFRDNPKLGLIGSKDLIRNEYDKKMNEFKTTNNSKIKELITRFKLEISDYRFVAGTMFWMRSSIIEKFFSANSALGCREMLEEGNFTDDHVGTYAHSWERVLCWLANAQGFIIKGI